MSLVKKILYIASEENLFIFHENSTKKAYTIESHKLTRPAITTIMLSNSLT